MMDVLIQGVNTDGEEVSEDGVLQGSEIKRMQRGQQCSSEGAAVRKEEERQDAAGRWGKHAWRRNNQVKSCWRSNRIRTETEHGTEWPGSHWWPWGEPGSESSIGTNGTENGRWRAGLCCPDISGREFLVKYNSGMERRDSCRGCRIKTELDDLTLLYYHHHTIYIPT